MKIVETKPAFWDEAIAYLSAKDPFMKSMAERAGTQCLTSRGQPFETLLRSITGQQISVKAADSVWARVLACIVDTTPAAVLARTTEELRACGLSGRKVEYLQSLSHAFNDGTVNPAGWAAKDDEALIKELIQVKGIGRWTAEMVLMFNALRPDVFAVDDVGLQNALKANYGLHTKAEWIAQAGLWAPYRSVASWLLWRSLDPIAVAY